jgi:ComF family protein
MPLATYEYATRNEGCSGCHGRSLGFDSAIALGPYDGPLRHLVLGLKNRSGAWVARWLIDLLVEVRGEDLRGLQADLVVPVPLHWRRRLSRRHNQAEALAGRLSRILGLESRNPLRRVRSTAKLAGKGRTERAALLRGAFSLRKPDLQLEGGVLLVDDVLTTGATCGSAARVLRKAGAKPVVAVVIARAHGRS